MWAYRAAALSGSDDIAQELLRASFATAKGGTSYLAQIELAQNVRPPSKRELMVEMFVQLAWFLPPAKTI